MEKAMYPSKYIRITQKDHIGTHVDSWAVDEAGIDGNRSNLIAPFTGIIKKIYTKDANEVWLESVEPVEYADGTVDFMTILLCHDNDVSDLFVGKVIIQGEVFYTEGVKGNATGNHVHLECARGKFTGTGWHENTAGYWSINNGKKVDECLFIDDSYSLIDTADYNFKKVVDRVGTPVARNEEVEQVRVFDTTTQLRGRNKPNGDILGYINSGIYNLLERKTDSDYEWFKVEDNLWFAYNPEWCEYLKKKDVPVEEPKPAETPTTDNKLKEENEALKRDLAHKDAQIKALQEQNSSLTQENEQLKSEQSELIFTCPETKFYKIELYEGEKLYIK